MERLKLFVTNFFVYGLGGAISKLVPFLMLPIVTRLMPNTTFFGLNDISHIIVSISSALAIMGMYDAMFRLFFEKEDEQYKKSICSSAFAFTLTMSILIFLVLIIGNSFFTAIFFGSQDYKILLYLTAISSLIGSTNAIVSAPTRFNNERKLYLLANTISSVLSYAIAIPLLINHLYIIALPLSSIIAALTIELAFYIHNKKWFSVSYVKIDLIKQMLIIALPLFPNFLIYWIFNSADKLMIAKILGNDQVGIYAIGSKIGQVSQLIYTAFAGGWQYFSFSTMKDADQVQLTSNILEYLAAITALAGIIMMTFNEAIFSLLFKGDYLKGREVSVYLFISPLLLMLFQIGCNQFIIIKKTLPSLFILLSGAIINIILNYVLIKVIGIEGAAIATLTGYTLSVTICIIILQKMKLLKMNQRFFMLAIVFAGYWAVWRFYLKYNLIYSIIACLIFFCFIFLLYLKDIQKLKNTNN